MSRLEESERAHRAALRSAALLFSSMLDDLGEHHCDQVGVFATDAMDVLLELGIDEDDAGFKAIAGKAGA